jgi:hypothetical protein
MGVSNRSKRESSRLGEFGIEPARTYGNSQSGGVLVRNPNRRFPLAVLLSLCVAACEFLTGDAVREWSEDVPLDGGDLVTIERRVEFKKSGSLAGDTYSTSVSRSTLSIKDPSATPPTWSDVLLPLVLYRDQSTLEWVLVASTTDCRTYRARGRPRPTYWEFRLRGSTWVETALSASSLERQTNLLYLYDEKLPTRHFTPASKASFQRAARTAHRYLSIQRDNSFNCG